MTMENVLLEASMSGNIDTLKTLIQNDQLILDRVLATFFNENPLHVATLSGHLIRFCEDTFDSQARIC
ncbi:hypothetical protein LguiB_002139 [Lonicera macranthoides]